VALLEPVPVELDNAVPVWLHVPVELTEPVPVRVLLDDDDDVPIADEVCEPANDVPGDGVHVLLAVVVGGSEGVSVESEAGRQGSATPPVDNATGTAV
jgi:hypothetical protein